MSDVIFRYNNGRERRMAMVYANVLSRLGHGTYVTREMRAAEERARSAAERKAAKAAKPVEPVVEPAVEASPPAEPEGQSEA